MYNIILLIFEDRLNDNECRDEILVGYITRSVEI